MDLTPTLAQATIAERHADAQAPCCVNGKPRVWHHYPDAPYRDDDGAARVYVIAQRAGLRSYTCEGERSRECSVYATWSEWRLLLIAADGGEERAADRQDDQDDGRDTLLLEVLPATPGGRLRYRTVELD